MVAYIQVLLLPSISWWGCIINNKSQVKYEEAESLFQKSLGIYEKALGKDHKNVMENYSQILSEK